MSNSWIDNNVKNFGVAPSIKSDLIANLPVTAAIGSLFISTDTFAWYRFNGSGWDLIGGAGVGDITGGGTVGELAKFTGTRVIGDAVAGVDYVVPSALNGYVPYVGATSNVNLGAFNLLATDGDFSGQVGIGLGTPQQAGAKLEIDGGDIFMRNGYSIGCSSGTSGSFGGGATLILRSIGNNLNEGYAELLSFYAGESLPYTAPLVIQNNGGAVLIGRSATLSGFKLQVAGRIFGESTGVPLALSSSNSNIYKIELREGLAIRGYIGASNTNCFVVGENSGGEVLSIANATGIASFTLKSGQNGNVVRLSRSAGAYTWGIGVSSNSEYIVTNNSGVTLFSINPNTGRNFAVGGITYANGTHAIKTLGYDAATSIVIDLPTEFPEMFLVSGNTWAVFGRCNLFSSTGQVEVREFYIGRNTSGTWAAAAYSTNSTTGASLQSVTGSGTAITVNMNAGTYLQVELTVMVR